MTHRPLARAARAFLLAAALISPVPAQQARDSVNLELRFVQARPAAAAALANKRVAGPGRGESRRTAKFADATTPTVHVFDKQGAIRGLINSERSRGELKQLAQPGLLTEPGRETLYVLGGRYPVPTVFDPNSYSGRELPVPPR